MREDGEWGGQQELYAAAQSLQINIYVHQATAPRFVFLFDNKANNMKSDSVCHKNGKNNSSHYQNQIHVTRSIQLSYHGECHYNSVRLISDETYDQTTENIILPNDNV